MKIINFVNQIRTRTRHSFVRLDAEKPGFGQIVDPITTPIQLISEHFIPYVNNTVYIADRST